MVSKDGNEIIFRDLSHPQVIDDFIKILNESIRNSKNQFILNFKTVQRAFPNVCTPLAGIIENLSKKGFQFDLYYLTDYLKSINLSKPLLVSEHPDLVAGRSLSKIWKFERLSDIHALVNSFRDSLLQNIVAEKGVLEGFEWSINEVLDNVLQHSTCDYGYVMGQLMPTSKKFVFCVFDTGQGIYNSLLQSIHKPSTPADSLELAVKEGVTRDKSIGQGNGLWGLKQIITDNVGYLTITSSGARYILQDDKAWTKSNIPQLAFDNGCIVDFQLDYSKEISVSRALHGHEPTNYFVESLEDESGQIILRLADKESGTGTRPSGVQIRNEVINLFKQTGRSIVLDFDGLPVIASSFADELIGKLVVEFGFFGFNNIIKLKNMNPTVQAIVQRSVAQRMMENLSGNTPT